MLHLLYLLSTFQIFQLCFHSSMLFYMYQFLNTSMPCFFSMFNGIYAYIFKLFVQVQFKFTYSTYPVQSFSQIEYMMQIAPETAKNQHPKRPTHAHFKTSHYPFQGTAIIPTFNSVLYFETQFYINKLKFLSAYN